MQSSSKKVYTKTMKNNGDGDRREEIFTLDEMQACIVYSALREHIRSRRWDALDEVQWSELVSYKNIVDRLERYLDGEASAAIDRCQTDVSQVNAR